MLRNNKEELENLRQQEALATNQKISRGVGVVDSIDIAAIFAAFLKETTHRFLEETGKYIMFPIAAAASIIQATLAWRQAKLDGGKKGSIVKAVVETGVAITITTAVVGALAFSSLFATAAPIIFASVLGAKTLFHTGSAFYYWGKSAAAADLNEKYQYAEKAKSNAVSAVALALTTAAVVSVMILGKVMLAGLGIAAGFLTTTYALYKGFGPSAQKGFEPASTHVEEISIDENLLGNTKRLSQGASITKRLTCPQQDSICPNVKENDETFLLRTSPVPNKASNGLSFLIKPQIVGIETEIEREPTFSVGKSM